MTENREHPGQDEELTGRYALGRLSSAERKVYEEHLRLCSDCRRLAEEELRLAAGIRAAGREDLRLRLRRHLAETGAAGHVPWPRVIAIAASFVLIVGLGIMQFWFSDGRETQEVPLVAESKEPRDSFGKKENAPSPPLARSEMRENAGKRDEGERAIAPVPQAEKSIGSVLPEGEPGRVKDARRDLPGAVEAGTMKTGNEAFLLQGEILKGGETSGLAQAEEGVRPAVEMNQPAKEKRGAEPLPSVRLQSAQNVQLLQRPRGEAPSLQEEGKSATRQMEAGFQRMNSQIVVTLYPDTPFTQEAIDRARADWIGPDTLRVTIGRETIIFRLPPPLQQAVPVR